MLDYPSIQTRWRRVLPLGALLLLGSFAAWGSVGTLFQIQPEALSQGAGSSESANYKLSTTLGQVAAGQTSSPGHSMEAGYWSEPSGTATGIEPTTPAAPLSSRLAQNHPNPFNPTTTIEFALSEAGRVEIQLFDAGGRRVRTLLDEHRQAGVHQLVLSANELASGVYWYRLQSGGFRAARRMVLLK